MQFYNAVFGREGISFMDKLEVIYYPHPTLRHRSQPILRVDAELKDMIQQMFELMYEHKGIGLAANQVDLPLQLFVINLESDPSKGEELVFINPVISQSKGSSTAEEGCLSIPKVYGNVTRPETSVHVQAYNLNGEVFDQRVDGLMARAIPHETDHLNGVLFPDRMSETEIKMIEGELAEFEIEYQSRKKIGGLPEPEAIQARLLELESRYCQKS